MRLAVAAPWSRSDRRRSAVSIARFPLPTSNDVVPASTEIEYRRTFALPRRSRGPESRDVIRHVFVRLVETARARSDLLRNLDLLHERRHLRPRHHARIVPVDEELRAEAEHDVAHAPACV